MADDIFTYKDLQGGDYTTTCDHCGEKFTETEEVVPFREWNMVVHKRCYDEMIKGTIYEQLDKGEITSQEYLAQMNELVDESLKDGTLTFENYSTVTLSNDPNRKIPRWRKMVNPFWVFFWRVRIFFRKLFKRKQKKGDRHKTTYREKTEIYDMMHDKIMNQIDLDDHDIELAEKHEIDLEKMLVEL